MGGTADWKGVGASLKALGDTLAGHANEGVEQVKAASSGAGNEVTDQVKAGGKAAVDKFDQAMADPAVGSAAKDATNKFLDAVKVTLTGGDEPVSADPPKPIDTEAGTDKASANEARTGEGGTGGGGTGGNEPGAATAG